MDFYNKIRNFIVKLQNLSDKKKKIILFSIIAISAIILLFFNIKSTGNSISKIGESVKTIDFPTIDFSEPNSNFQNNELNSGVEMSNIEINNFTSSESDGIFQNQNSDWHASNASPALQLNSSLGGGRSDAGWQTYKNELHGFAIDHPKEWYIDENQTTGLDIWLEKKVEKEVADIHIEVVSKTKNIKSAQEGMNYIVSQMKDVIKLEEKIMIGNYEAYEVIGTICTSICRESSDDSYYPFSVIYLSNNDTVIKIKYSEGTLDVGWKNTIKDWKYYDEYKKIISTLTFNTR